MWLTRLDAIASFFLAAILSAPALGTTTSANSALPGTLNYVEGQASLNARALDSKSVGSAELQPGQSLTTEKGKAEILLTPGVFLRVGNNSSVRMISPSLTDTEVGVTQGQAMIEVAEIHPAEETIWAAVAELRRWIERYGVPQALYTDWKNVYVRQPERAGADARRTSA